LAGLETTVKGISAVLCSVASFVRIERPREPAPDQQHNVRSGFTPHPLEQSLALGMRRLLQWTIPLVATALVFPAPDAGQGLLAYTLAHLTLVQVATFLLVLELAPMTRTPWFVHVKRPWLASAVSVVAVAVGFSALITLATSAAARYDVSLQFLQLLSSLDIAWVVAALYLGSLRLWSRTTATVAGALLLIACVVSIAVYLVVVGFTPGGGWLVDGSRMLTIVIPSDVMAAIISLTVLLRASRMRQRT